MWGKTSAPLLTTPSSSWIEYFIGPMIFLAPKPFAILAIVVKSSFAEVESFRLSKPPKYAVSESKYLKTTALEVISFFSLKYSLPKLLSKYPLFVINWVSFLKLLIDTKGNIVIAPIYDDTLIFREGLAAVKINNKYGFNEKCICISCYKKDNRLKCYETFDKAYTTENYTDFVK